MRTSCHNLSERGERVRRRGLVRRVGRRTCCRVPGGPAGVANRIAQVDTHSVGYMALPWRYKNIGCARGRTTLLQPVRVRRWEKKPPTAAPSSRRFAADAGRSPPWILYSSTGVPRGDREGGRRDERDDELSADDGIDEAWGLGLGATRWPP